MGLKMECNTRRFVLDDRRELQYRVEVQNRVYKKEIANLDSEIKKLERMLESGTASTRTSSSTSIFAAFKVRQDSKIYETFSKNYFLGVHNFHSFILFFFFYSTSSPK